MLRQVAEGVLIHESEFMQSNAVVVQGRAGALLIDPGVTGSEIASGESHLRAVSKASLMASLPDPEAPRPASRHQERPGSGATPMSRECHLGDVTAVEDERGI